MKSKLQSQVSPTITPIATSESLSTAIGIGGVTVRVRASDPAFLRVLEQRYEGFIGDWESTDYEFSIDLVPSGATVSVKAQFTGTAGTYVFHCHNVEHEDHAMMNQFELMA